MKTRRSKKIVAVRPTIHSRIATKYTNIKGKAVLVKDFTKLAIRHPVHAKAALDEHFPVTGAVLGLAGAAGAVYLYNHGPKIIQKAASNGKSSLSKWYTRKFGNYYPEEISWDQVRWWNRAKLRKSLQPVDEQTYGAFDKHGKPTLYVKVGRSGYLD